MLSRKQVSAQVSVFTRFPERATAEALEQLVADCLAINHLAGAFSVARRWPDQVSEETQETIRQAALAKPSEHTTHTRHQRWRRIQRETSLDRQADDGFLDRACPRPGANGLLTMLDEAIDIGVAEVAPSPLEGVLSRPQEKLRVRVVKR
ncbi:MAG: hypothetical protein AB7S38_28935 [Vulcanimicrobiota bacterium]